MAGLHKSQERLDLAKIENRAESVPRLFRDRVAATPNSEAFRYPDGTGGWTSVTWAQANERVDLIAAGLISLGIQPPTAWRLNPPPPAAVSPLSKER